METEIQIDFIKEDSGKVVGAMIDIVDFMFICHAGKDKNTALFKRLIQTVEDMNEEIN